MKLIIKGETLLKTDGMGYEIADEGLDLFANLLMKSYLIIFVCFFNGLIVAADAGGQGSSVWHEDVPRSIADCIHNDNRRLLFAIADPKATESEWKDAFMKLGYVDEDPAYWAQIANSETYEQTRRTAAIYQLFSRHIHPPIKVSVLSKLLSSPTWLQSTNLVEVNSLGGWVPLKLNPSAAIFRLQIGPHDFVWFNVVEPISEERLVKILRGEIQAGTDDPEVFDIAW